MSSATSRDREGNAGGRSILTDGVICACLVAAFLAALWSLKTTYLGMNLIFKDSAGALVFASIIQLWLLGVSLVLGGLLARRFLDLHARNTGSFITFLWISFAITLLISMFFSYVNYLNNTFALGQDELSDRATAAALVQRIIPGLSDAVEVQRGQAIDDFLGRPGVKAWKTDIGKLLKAAADPESREVVAKATAETVRIAQNKRQEAERIHREADAARAALPALRAEQDEKRAKVDRLDKQIKDIEALLTVVDGRVVYERTAR